MIKRTGNKFFVEVFNPIHDWKLMGVVININIPDTVECFVTHFKKPESHFYIKGRGYPVNDELLHMLKNAHINYIIIPEDGKTGFKAYICEVSEYLDGELISEPLTERQRSIPLSSMQEVPMDKDKLKKILYYN